MKTSIIASIVLAIVSTSAMADKAANTHATAGHSHDKSVCSAKKTGNGIAGAGHVGGLAAYSSSHSDGISRIYGSSSIDITDSESLRAAYEEHHAEQMKAAYQEGQRQALDAVNHTGIAKGDRKAQTLGVTGTYVQGQLEAQYHAMATMPTEQVDTAPHAGQSPRELYEARFGNQPMSYATPTMKVPSPVEQEVPNMIPQATPYQVPAKPVMNVPHAVPQATPYQVPAQPTMKTPNMVPIAVPYQVPTPIVDLGTPVQVGKVPSVVKHPTVIIDNHGDGSVPVVVVPASYCINKGPHVCYDAGVQSIKDIVAHK